MRAMSGRSVVLILMGALIALACGIKSVPAFASSTPTPGAGTGALVQVGVAHRVGHCSLAHHPSIVPTRAVVISKVNTAQGTLVVYRFHSVETKVTYLASGKCLYTVYHITSTTAATATPVATATAPVATPAPTTSAGSTTGESTTSAGNTPANNVYSPTNPAPVIPSGAKTVSQSTTASGTLVVYQSGGAYYNVTYLPDGRYVYTITQAPGSSVSTLPATGGGSPSAPSAPWVPAFLSIVLIVAGVTVRRLSRTR